MKIRLEIYGESLLDIIIYNIPRERVIKRIIENQIRNAFIREFKIKK